MTDEEKYLSRDFTLKVHNLLLQYKQLEEANVQLQTLLTEKNKEIERLNAQLQISKNEYETLKLARMIQVSDTDLQNAHKRITRLVKEVNKCIGLLSSDYDEN